MSSNNFQSSKDIMSVVTMEHQTLVYFFLWENIKEFPIKKYYAVKEYYFDSRKEGRQKTDAEYSVDFLEFIADVQPTAILIVQSAATFINQLHRDGVKVIVEANNGVMPGIANDYA